MQYELIRKNLKDSDWKTVIRGSRSFILGILKRNLESHELEEYEWLVRRVKP